MFKAKLIISVSLFFTLLVVTSVIKNQTRIIEKKIVNLKANVLNKKNVINEAQLDFHYLSSPSELEKKINIIGFKKYQPIKHSNIFYSFHDFSKLQNKISKLKGKWKIIQKKRRAKIK